MHENPAHDVGNENPGAIFGKKYARTFSRRPQREIGRSQEALLARGEDQRLTLIPNMIASGDDVRTSIDRIVENLFGDAKAAGRIFTVNDCKVEFQIGDKARQLFINGCTARAAHHITKKK